LDSAGARFSIAETTISDIRQRKIDPADPGTLVEQEQK
jgi:hypothetical protein